MNQFILLLMPDQEQADEIQSVLVEYTVLCCSNAQQAEELCRRHPVDLALLVHDPPQDDACSLLLKLRECRQGLAAVLLARSVDKVLLNNALEAGFFSLLEMPVRSEQVIRTVRRIMAQVEVQAENARLRTLLPLYSLGEQFLSSTTEKEVLVGLLSAITDITGSNNISVLLLDAAKEELYIAAATGMDEQLVESIRVLPGENIAGWVFEHGKSVILNKEDQDRSIFAPFLRRPEIRSAISCPLQIRGEIVGVLNISRTEIDERFSEADMEMVNVVCAQATMALDNVRALTRMKEITRVRTLLEQYVAPEVAELLLERDEDLMKVGGVQTVTILFADIRNFTRLVQYLDFNQLRSFLNDFFNIFTETVFEKEGTVDKFMGDAVLAVFGAPLANRNANQAAVEAALMIKAKFNRLRERWGKIGAIFKDLDLGIGITCGEVFLGNVGSCKRLDFTVIGREVNVAQRLAAESTPCKIFLTDEVRSSLPDDFELERQGLMLLRGLNQELEVYAVSGNS